MKNNVLSNELLYIILERYCCSASKDDMNDGCTTEMQAQVISF